MRKIVLPACLLSFSTLFLLNACSDVNEKEAEETVAKTEYRRAVAVLHPTEGNEAQGVVMFAKVANGVKVVADISGLTPGKHGFHIHEYGDCTFADATSAGGHFNPFDMPHGAPTDERRHVGDLGNLTADSTGRAHYEWTDTILTLNGPNSIIGRALIVHQGEDNLKSQPTGNAGARVACGVIGIARQENAR